MFVFVAFVIWLINCLTLFAVHYVTIRSVTYFVVTYYIKLSNYLIVLIKYCDCIYWLCFS